jgi:hypothetical protein
MSRQRVRSLGRLSCDNMVWPRPVSNQTPTTGWAGSKSGRSPWCSIAVTAQAVHKTTLRGNDPVPFRNMLSCGLDIVRIVRHSGQCELARYPLWQRRNNEFARETFREPIELSRPFMPSHALHHTTVVAKPLPVGGVMKWASRPGPAEYELSMFRAPPIEPNLSCGHG